MSKIAICDDEYGCIEALAPLCRSLPTYEFHDEYQSGEALIHAIAEGYDPRQKPRIQSKDYDLVFMDIQLMGGTLGIDVAKQVREYLPDCVLIFVSGHSEMITKTFSIQPDGFLLKPVTKEQFEEAVQTAYANRRDKEEEHRFSFEVGRGAICAFKQKEILYVESGGHSIKIVHTKNMPPVKVHTSMEEAEKLFCPHGFARSHRAYLINLSKIHRIYKHEIIVENGDKILISKSYKAGLMHAYRTHASRLMGAGK